MAALQFGRLRKPVPYFRTAFHLKLILLAVALGVVVGGIEYLVSSSGEDPRFSDPISAEAIGIGTNRPGAGTGAGGTRADRPGEENTLGVASSAGQSPGISPGHGRTPPARLVITGVQDNRRVVPSEWDQWLEVFRLLDESSAAALISAGAPRASYLQLMAQPESYRGRLIRTVGFVRRAHRVRPPNNPWNIEHYHQLWLQVDDHPDDPVAVWCIDLPSQFPLGMSIEERAEVVGYFFKVMTYVAGDGTLRRAPLILAKTIAWHPRPVIVHKPRWEAVPYVVVSAVVIAAFATGWIWWRTRPRRKAEAAPHPLLSSSTSACAAGPLRFDAEIGPNDAQ